jgi:hypothetical protein
VLANALSELCAGVDDDVAFGGAALLEVAVLDGVEPASEPAEPLDLLVEVVESVHRLLAGLSQEADVVGERCQSTGVVGWPWAEASEELVEFGA